MRTAVIPLKDLRKRCSQRAQLLAPLGLNGLDLRWVVEALQELAELGFAFLRCPLTRGEFPRPGRSHQLLGLRVADLHQAIL